MKNFKLLFIMMAAVMFAVSCTEEEASIEDLSTKKATFYDTVLWDAIDFCGPERSYDLIGGQDILMGSVVVGNDENNLYVKYQADSGYVITETHLFVGSVMDGDFPKTKKGNPKIGHFPYASEKLEGSTVVVYSIPLIDIEGDCFDVAAHAVVECDDFTCEETAWGAGRSSVGEIVYGLKTRHLPYENWSTMWTGEWDSNEYLSWCYTFDYYTYDLTEFVSIEKDLYPAQGSVLVERMDENNLKFTISSSNYDIDYTNLFVGSEDDLLTNYYDGICPNYGAFPKYETTEITKTQEIIVNISEFLEESSTANEFEGVRWGFYFNYCKSVCN